MTLYNFTGKKVKQIDNNIIRDYNIQKITEKNMKLKETVKAISSGYKAHLSDNNIFLDEYYTKEKNERQKYDLVFPKNVKGKIGLVLCIHGGGWVQSSKDEYTKSLFKLSEEYSLAAACINYRYVSESVTFNDVCDDITSALESIKLNILQIL